MFRSVIPLPPRRGKYQNRWTCAKDIKEAKGTQVYMTFVIHGTGKRNRSWSDRAEQEVVKSF